MNNIIEKIDEQNQLISEIKELLAQLQEVLNSLSNTYGKSE